MRSQASNLTVLVRLIASVMSALPKSRASFALMGRSKKNQIWPPFPDLERSALACRPRDFATVRMAETASCQPLLSKSITKTDVVESLRST